MATKTPGSLPENTKGSHVEIESLVEIRKEVGDKRGNIMQSRAKTSAWMAHYY